MYTACGIAGNETCTLPETDALGTTHRPVLLREALGYLAVRPGGTYIDATFGGGGHTRAILEASAPDGIVLAVDADPEAVDRAVELARVSAGRVVPCHGNFAELAELARRYGFERVDGVLFDLGLSSFQLASAARGFSFQRTGPLDMRFDPTRGHPASVIVNTWSFEQLATVLARFGEERNARKIARAIIEARQHAPIETTSQLAEIVSRVAGRRRGIHPATLTFQALRIAVNQELEALEAGLAAAVDLLRPGGRLVVIAFHSLEDRVVKQFMRQRSQACRCPPGTPVCTCGQQPQLQVITRKPVRPDPSEIRSNPRSRSARLRAAERLP